MEPMINKPKATTVKLDPAIHRKAKTVAADRGLDLADYLNRTIRPIVDRDYASIGQDEARPRPKKGD